MLEAARLATAGMDAFKAKARTLAEGLEPELAVSVDVMFPVAQLTAAVQAFQQAFPDTPLRLYVEALGAVFQPLLDGHCRVAITGSLPHLPAGCISEFLLQRACGGRCLPEHPLANASGPILRSLLQEHVQLVLTDRSSHRGPKLWRHVVKDMAFSGYGREARLPACRTGVGLYAAANGRGRSRSGKTGYAERADAARRRARFSMQAVHGGTSARPGRTLVR